MAVYQPVNVEPQCDLTITVVILVSVCLNICFCYIIISYCCFTCKIPSVSVMRFYVFNLFEFLHVTITL